MIRRASGFTLIETLIAGLILFSALSIATMLYRNAADASIKAQQRLTMSKAVPFILEQIRFDIRNAGNQQQLTGNGELLATHFQWQAATIQQAAPPAEFDVTTGQLIQQPARFKLWQVDVAMTIDGYTMTRQLKEVSW